MYNGCTAAFDSVSEIKNLPKCVPNADLWKGFEWVKFKTLPKVGFCRIRVDGYVVIELLHFLSW